MSATGEPQTVQLTSLSPSQLKMLHDQLDQEVQLLTTSMQSLKSAQNQFSESKQNLKQLNSNNLGKSILVPMNGSLYVPGKLSDIDNVLVDIGTGYFVEKSTTEADEFFSRKIDYLKQQMDKVQPTLQQKFQTKQIVLEVLQSKLMHQSATKNKNWLKTACGINEMFCSL